MKNEDIIYLEHHTSKSHPRMSMRDRAAQFSPFAALTGFEAVIEETEKKHLSVNDKQDEDTDYFNQIIPE